MTIVIGGAAGGYVAGIRSAQLARRTAVVARDIRIDWDALASRRAKVSENLSNGVSFSPGAATGRP